MIEIREFSDADTEAVIALVLHCQNDGTRPMKTVRDQPELEKIRQTFFANGGGFWVAEEDGSVVGCIGLLLCGNGLALLKKFFVYEAYRGAPTHLGQRLFAELKRHAVSHTVRAIYLDTPKNTARAHAFYERAGFEKVEREDLPFAYHTPYDDCDFFRLSL